LALLLWQTETEINSYHTSISRSFGHLKNIHHMFRWRQQTFIAK